MFQRVNCHGGLALLGFHIVRSTLLLLKRSIAQLAWSNVRDRVSSWPPRWIWTARIQFWPRDNTEAAHGFVIHGNDPGDLGCLFAPNGRCSALMHVGDKYNIGNDVFGVALENESIRQLANEV